MSFYITELCICLFFIIFCEKYHLFSNLKQMGIHIVCIQNLDFQPFVHPENLHLQKLETKAMTTSSQCDTGRTCLSLPIVTTEKNLACLYTLLRNHSNTCAENRKIRGLKFDTLYWRHLAAYRKI